jgi:hypothetical protein
MTKAGINPRPELHIIRLKQIFSKIIINMFHGKQLGEKYYPFPSRTTAKGALSPSGSILRMSVAVPL